ncbi:MCE family protein [Mycolicibacterium phlei]|uniref:MCE family protein n=1 Tax=Mycolicibacterium phlei TaxID=1771 RepID=UPI000590BF97|nr:MCE family protein [Mycolicibacterium phlei]
MGPQQRRSRISNKWCAVLMVASILGAFWFSWALYNRQFTRYATVTLTSDRSGLVMERGNPVKMRGVIVGRVAGLDGGRDAVSLTLNVDPRQLAHIPANVEARITASTAFGPKYVDLVPPSTPSATPLASGAVLRSTNVATEVNTVFDNLVALLDQIDPAKLNGILTTLADGLRGRGPRIGEATTSAAGVMAELNANSDSLRRDFRSLRGFTDAYAAAAPALVKTLESVATTSTTIAEHASDLDALLLAATGFADRGNELLGVNKDKLVDAVNILHPTTSLLYKYKPQYTCLLVGARWYLDNGIYDAAGGANGYSLITDTAVLLANDPYRYPEHLPKIAAKGGPGGKPGCGSLPDASKNFPVRYLVTDTGWGRGIDVRPNPGLGHPCFGNYFPVTRAVPEPATYRCVGPPSPGLVLPATPPPPPPPAPVPPADDAPAPQP